MTHKYTIDYLLNGETRQDDYDAPNPGEAFAKCLKENPGATLLHCTRYGKILQQYVLINYDPPPVQRPLAKQVRMGKTTKTPTSEEMTFPFFEECRRRTTP